jgi:hypothetical protein
MKGRQKIEEGDQVLTPEPGRAVKTGTVELISDDGRYARVRKRYGKRSWVNMYAIETLKLIAKGAKNS